MHFASPAETLLEIPTIEGIRCIRRVFRHQVSKFGDARGFIAIRELKDRGRAAAYRCTALISLKVTDICFPFLGIF